MVSTFNLVILAVIFSALNLEFVSGKKLFWPWSPRRGCEYEGDFYKTGDVVDVSIDTASGVCDFLRCQDDGEVVQLSLRNCPLAVNSMSTPTTPPPTTPITTTRLGCDYNDHHYELGSTIEEGQSDDWCWSVMCDYNGQVIYGDNFDCSPKSSSTPRQTTTSPRPTTPPPGCYTDGRFYEPGEKISHGQTGNWCYWTICNKQGEIIAGDDFNCMTTPTTLTPTTTAPPTTPTTLNEEERVLLKRLFDTLRQRQNK